MLPAAAMQVLRCMDGPRPLLLPGFGCTHRVMICSKVVPSRMRTNMEEVMHKPHGRRGGETIVSGLDFVHAPALQRPGFYFPSPTVDILCRVEPCQSTDTCLWLAL